MVFWLFLLAFFLVPFVGTWMFRHPRYKDNQRARVWGVAIYSTLMALFILVLRVTNFLASPNAVYFIIMSMSLGVAVGWFVSRVES